MHTKARLAASVAILVSAASAAPVLSSSGSWPSGQAGGPHATPSWTSSASASSSIASAAVPLKSGNPFSFPLSNGFPDSPPSQAIAIQAHGTAPNGAAPVGLAADDLTSFRLIAFNEIFEVAFFTDLLYNVTNNVSGFDAGTQRQTIIDALTAIQAQEELHADSANAILKANSQQPIEPCQYKFPTTNLKDALSLAATFTDVVLGTLQDVQLHLATNNDNGLVPVIGSVIGQEGEQTGFFRSFVGKIPSALPFLTRSTREFAFSALNQNFVVPGSCPSTNKIDLPIFTPLNVLTQNIQPADQTPQFSLTADKPMPPANVSLVYINGQNVPVVQPLQNVQANNATGLVTFSAPFPYSQNLLNGLTIAAVTSTAGPFANAEEVAKVTIAGPGIIEV